MKKTTFVISVLIFVLLFVSCKNANTNTHKNFKTLEDINGSIFAIEQGSIFDRVISDYYGSKYGAQRTSTYPVISDCITSVLIGKSDVTITDLPVAQVATATNNNIMIFPEYFLEDEYGYGFPKNSPIRAQFNRAMAELKKEGLDEELQRKWISKEAGTPKIIEQNWDGSNGIWRYWVEDSGEPMSYTDENNILQGYSIDFLLHVAKRLNYKVEICSCSVSSLIPSAMSGKADIIGATLSITEERKKSIDFSDPFYEGAVVLIARTADIDPSVLKEHEITLKTENKNFFEKIAESFNNTFLVENRYKVFLHGILNTIGITVCSALAGTVLGLLLHLRLRKARPSVKKVFSDIFDIISGLPIVVLLMIFFYILFAHSNISGFAVSVISFSIVFAISVNSILQRGTDSLGRNQKESAYALGFSENAVFIHILYPQARKFIHPLYQDALISLIQGTAVVGYVAVQDLTRAGDVIRSKTFDAFFSLIFTALVYLLLERLLVLVVKIISKKTDTYKRSKNKILKGVNL